MRRDLRLVFNRSALLKVIGDPRRPESVTADIRGRPASFARRFISISASMGCIQFSVKRRVRAPGARIGRGSSGRMTAVLPMKVQTKHDHKKQVATDGQRSHRCRRP
jgi:hypothetical protein